MLALMILTISLWLVVDPAVEDCALSASLITKNQSFDTQVVPVDKLGLIGGAKVKIACEVH